MLARERAVVDKAVADLFDVLGPDDERELANPLRAELRAYRQASDGVISVALEREALVQYHQKANPVLRRAVALTTAIRDRHFEFAREAVAGARDEAAAARRAVPVDHARRARDCRRCRLASDAHRRGTASDG